MQAMSQVAEVTQRAEDEKAKTEEEARVSDGLRRRWENIWLIFEFLLKFLLEVLLNLC